jgi:hypothetical protein
MAIEWAPLRNVMGPPFGRQSRDIRAGDDAAKLFAYEGPGVAVLHSEAGDAILESWTVDGDTFGDDWYQSIQDAKEVAVKMWGDDLGEWRSVPESVADYRPYVLEAARAALNL